MTETRSAEHMVLCAGYCPRVRRRQFCFSSRAAVGTTDAMRLAISDQSNGGHDVSGAVVSRPILRTSMAAFCPGKYHSEVLRPGRAL
jgi:hypothetical protein